MKAFFVYLDIKNTQPVGYQVGLGYVCAMVKLRGHQTRYFSPQAIAEIDGLIQEIKNDRPDVIAFSVVSTQFKYAKRIAKQVKEFYNPKIVCGGMHPTISPEAIEESKHIDAFVRGEGEYPLSEFMECCERGADYRHIDNFWFREKGALIQNKMRPLIQDLDVLPFPDRESFDFQQTLDKIGFCSFVFSRGCPFDCTYCCNSVFNELYGVNSVRFRSVAKALEEIDRVLSRYHVKCLNFDDDNFTLNKEWFFNFVDAYKRLTKKKFFCNARVGTCTFDMLKALKEANCTGLLIGVESGDEEYRRTYLNRPMTNHQIRETFDMAHKAGLKTYSFNIVGFPYETPRNFEKTIELNAQIHPNTPFLVIFYPYPKTHLRKICEKDNLLVAPDLEDLVDRERDEPVVRCPEFSKDAIMFYYKNFRYLVLKKVSMVQAVLYQVRQKIKKLLQK